MSTASNPSYERFTGLDVARGLAIIGMVLVNYMYVLSYEYIHEIEMNESAIFGHSGFGLLVAGFVLLIVAGRAASIFLVLFGIGMMLQIKRAQFRFRREVILPLVIRYLILIAGGLWFARLWEADILHYIGLYGLIAIVFTRVSRSWLIISIIAILGFSEILRIFFDYNAGWKPGAVGFIYEDMWSIPGYFRQMFFNGYHPVFPWLVFILYGLVLGRCNLNDRSLHLKLIGFGLAGSLCSFTLTMLGFPAEFFPPHTLFILLGIANTSWIIGLSLFLAEKGKAKRLIRWLGNMGRLALTHYLGHVFLGIVPILIYTAERMNLSFEASFFVSVTYLLATMIFGNIWLKFQSQGPLEKVLRVISKAPVQQRRKN